MKKKIIFVSDSLRIGGIQRSLVNLLNSIDLNKYDVDLFLFNDYGEYKPLLRKEINIITGRVFLKLAGMTSIDSKNKGIHKYIYRKILALMCAIFGSDKVFRLFFLFEKDIKGYDVAISYSNNVGDRTLYFGYNKFVLEKVEATKKIAWIHVDYDKYNLNTKTNSDEYKKFDKIINVSKATMNTFIKSVCECEYKAEYIYNILQEDEIKLKAGNVNPYEENMFNIVTVSRLDSNKAVHKQLEIAKLLKESDIMFRWNIIGDGSEYYSLLEYIKTNGLEENVILRGYCINPYPYMKFADLFVSTSRSESFGLSIAESLILNTPVVARYFDAAIEIISDGINGIIVENSDQMYDCIMKLIINKKFYADIKKNSKLINMNNKKTLLKIDSIFNS